MALLIRPGLWLNQAKTRIQKYSSKLGHDFYFFLSFSIKQPSANGLIGYVLHDREGIGLQSLLNPEIIFENLKFVILILYAVELL